MPGFSSNSNKWLFRLAWLCLGHGLVSVPRVHSQPAMATECDQSGGAGDSQELKACKMFSCQARRRCEDAKNAASSQNDGEAQKLKNQYKGKNQVAEPAFELSDLGKRSANSLAQASAYCRGLSGGAGGAAQNSKQADKTCRSECNPGKIGDNIQRAAQQKREMQKERESCVSALEQVAQGLDQGRADNQKAQEDAQKTGEQAQSGQGQQSGGQSGDQPQDNSGQPQSQAEEKSAQENLKTAGCDGSEAASKPECASVLQNTCRGDNLKNDSRCRQFAASFCAPGSSASTSVSGAGAELCQENRQNEMVVKFCATPGRSHCPSCSGQAAAALTSSASASASELARICGTCSSGESLDPMYSNPAVIRACARAKSDPNGGLRASSAGQSGNSSGAGLNAGSGGASGASGGGGGGGGYGSGGEASLTEGKGLREESFYGQLNKNMGAGSGGSDGGGGGYTYGGRESDSSFGHQNQDEGGAFGRSLAGGNWRSSRDNAAPPLATGKVPAVFLIQSMVIRNRCDKGQFMHCEKTK
jgi:hypothetical protein